MSMSMSKRNPFRHGHITNDTNRKQLWGISHAKVPQGMLGAGLHLVNLGKTATPPAPRRPARSPVHY